MASTASGNGVAGIHVDGDAANISKNRAVANGFTGGPDLAGLGIFVENFTTPPRGTNTARGNDDPSECSPAALC
jgi:hypothetical protein